MKATRLFLCGLVAVTACGSRAGSSSGQPRDPNLITAQQITNGRFQTAYDAVQALHPNWLTPRGTDSFAKPSEVRVYYNWTSLGSVETLRTVRTSEVAYIRWYDGTQAQQRFGVGHSAGVIYVSSHTE